MNNFTPGAPTNNLSAMGSNCRECGMMHPPVAGGCPMKAEKTADGQEIPIDKIMPQFKNIIVSQIRSKDIKDFNTLFTKLILNTTKFLEEYEETQ